MFYDRIYQKQFIDLFWFANGEMVVFVVEMVENENETEQNRKSVDIEGTNSIQMFF